MSIVWLNIILSLPPDQELSVGGFRISLPWWAFWCLPSCPQLSFSAAVGEAGLISGSSCLLTLLWAAPDYGVEVFLLVHLLAQVSDYRRVYKSGSLYWARPIFPQWYNLCFLPSTFYLDQGWTTPNHEHITHFSEPISRLGLQLDDPAWRTKHQI